MKAHKSMIVSPMRVLIVFAVCFCVLPGSISAGDIELQMRPVKTSFLEGEPVFVTYSITNGLDKPLEIRLGLYYGSEFFFFSKSSQGPWLSSKLVSVGGFWPVEKIKLRPGEIGKGALLLDNWLHLDAGKHKIFASFASGSLKLKADVEIVIRKGDLAAVKAALEDLLKLVVEARTVGSPYRNSIYVDALKSWHRSSEAVKELLASEEQSATGKRLEVVQEVRQGAIYRRWDK